MSCHKKTLILGGTLVRHPSLKWVTAAPCERREYMDLGEKPSEASRLQETTLSSSQAWEILISLVKWSYHTISARQNDRQNWRSQPSPLRDALTVMKGAQQELNRSGKSSAVGTLPLQRFMWQSWPVYLCCWKNRDLNQTFGSSRFFYTWTKLSSDKHFFRQKDMVVHYSSEFWLG
jgi:hypothetical protein